MLVRFEVTSVFIKVSVIILDLFAGWKKTNMSIFIGKHFMSTLHFTNIFPPLPVSNVSVFFYNRFDILIPLLFGYHGEYSPQISMNILIINAIKSKQQ